MDPRRLEEGWDVDEPPADFAERVVERALSERLEPRVGSPTISPRSRRAYAVGVALLAAAAALVIWWRAATPSASGEEVASARKEIALGQRALAVLEAGAHVAWEGPRVEQDRGDVFYRVEPGARFVVRTPVGEVAVLGTCFRVRVLPAAQPGGSDMKRKETLMAAGGAALGALVVVTVYEGRVQLSHAQDRITLAAGESGKLSANGAERASESDIDAAESALADARKGDALSSANENLARDIADLNRKLSAIEKEKAKLQQQLTNAEVELAKQTDAAAPRTRPEFDLDKEDWAELAKSGSVKFRVPCMRPQGWKPGPETLDRLGLSPDDSEPIQAAYQRSFERLWKTIGPLCAKAVGSEEVAEVIGPDSCTHVVMDVARRKDRESATEAMRAISEVRAGLAPPPSDELRQHPVFQVFWALTSELPEFERDLAQSLGPDEARRLAYSDEICASHSTFGGPGPREPKK